MISNSDMVSHRSAVSMPHVCMQGTSDITLGALKSQDVSGTTLCLPLSVEEFPLSDCSLLWRWGPLRAG